MRFLLSNTYRAYIFHLFFVVVSDRRSCGCRYMLFFCSTTVALFIMIFCIHFSCLLGYHHGLDYVFIYAAVPAFVSYIRFMYFRYIVCCYVVNFENISREGGEGGGVILNAAEGTFCHLVWVYQGLGFTF